MFTHSLLHSTDSFDDGSFSSRLLISSLMIFVPNHLHTAVPVANQFSILLDRASVMMVKRYWSLVDANCDTKEFTEFIVNTNIILGTNIHGFGNSNKPFLNSKFPHTPPQCRSLNSIKSLFKVNKVKISSCWDTFLHLSKNEYSVNCNTSWHETKFHII